jgi:deazaflavin-dependent oxidoreductase (nitroreductase family)
MAGVRAAEHLLPGRPNAGGEWGKTERSCRLGSLGGDACNLLPGAMVPVTSWTVPSQNQRIIDEFHANAGRVGGHFEGRTLLLLHHRGAKTGTERVNPVAYQRVSDDKVAVFATKGGAPTNPDWYYNLVSNPDVSVEIGTETFAARAHVAEGEEREPIWERQKRDWPAFGDYEEKTEGIREIPVVVLELG